MQIIFLLIIIGLIIFCYNIRTDINKKKIAILYTIEIGVILLFSTFNPYGLFEVSDYTYILWIICLLFFIIPFLLFFKKKANENEDEDKNKKKVNIDNVINSKIVNGLFIFNFIILIFYKIKYEIITKNLPIYEIRIARFETLFGSAFENLFFNYIIAGLVLIATIIFAILLVNKKIKNILFWICGLTIVIYSLIGYGRMMFLNLVICVIVTILISNNIKSLINKKNIIKFLITIILFLLICTIMLYARTYNKDLSFIENFSNTFNDQIQQVITYVTGGLRMLDNYIYNGFDNINGLTFGRATFAGFEEIILYPLKGIGFEIDSYNNLISETTQEYVVIGENNYKFNAFYTCVMNFYSDFGLAGVFIFPTIYALFIAWVFKNYNNKKTFSSLLLLNYSVMILIFSILRWNLQFGSYTLILIILLLINFYNIWKEKNEKNNQNTKKNTI